ncbi:hypothetical protein BGZ68_001130 [Mortierella alpina]|nr:hypothetical protein BGZ68_001130 [Mortierella alpina]
MGTTHEGSIRGRGNRFFDIGVVGRRTGITVKPNVKKDADGLDNIDDFWDDGNDTSGAPAPLKDQTQRQERYQPQAKSLHARDRPVVEAQELELSRRQHPPGINDFIDPEFVDDVLHDIPEELLSTPASRRSRSDLNSTASNPVYTFASDRPQPQERRVHSSAIHDSSRDEYPSPSYQAVKRHIDFSQDLSEAEQEFEGTPIINPGASHRSPIPRGRRERVGMDSQDDSRTRGHGHWTPTTLPTLASRPSKAFDLELAESGSVSGPDDIDDEGAQEDDEGAQEDDDSLQLPETPSRASHSILVSATPVHLKGRSTTGHSLKSKVASEEALPEQDDYHKVPPAAAGYQFSDEEQVRDLGHEEYTVASDVEENRRTALFDKKSVAEASGRELEAIDTSHSEDDAPPKRRMIRPRRAASTKKPAGNISDQSMHEVPPRSNKPRQAKNKDAAAVTTRSAKVSGLELRKRRELPQESTTLTVVPLERKDKPVDQDGPGVRRSNRVTFKPLEYWRNERVILGRSDNTPQPVPIIKGVVRAPPPEPLVGRSTKRARGTVQPSTTKSRTKTATRHLKSRTRHVDDGVEADEEDEDHSSDPELLRQQGYAQGTNQQFECIDQATGTVIVRAEPKDAMQFQDVPGGHYQYHRGLEDDDTISSGIVRIPGLGTKPNKNASASSVVYYVIQGTVQVTIYKSTVILHRGGRFLVPQGNQYMIKNLSRKECLLFFAQSKSAMPVARMPLVSVNQGPVRGDLEPPR